MHALQRIHKSIGRSLQLNRSTSAKRTSSLSRGWKICVSPWPLHLSQQGNQAFVFASSSAPGTATKLGISSSSSSSSAAAAAQGVALRVQGMANSHTSAAWKRTPGAATAPFAGEPLELVASWGLPTFVAASSTAPGTGTKLAISSSSSLSSAAAAQGVALRIANLHTSAEWKRTPGATTAPFAGEPLELVASWGLPTSGNLC
mmetsp:Transcript_78187/g.253823  ORF Transcript_78187/g.253823 Transcript_78187/m.253823 type:complete len:203 (+) Transcript_78187:97-705(+)